MSKIKLTYIVSSLANEGPVNVMYNIIKHIDYNQFDVDIITLVPEKKHSRFKEFEMFNISIHQLAKSSSLGVFEMFLSLKRLLKLLEPQIIHSHCPRSLFLVGMLSKKYKRCYTAHIYPGIQQKALYGNLLGSIVVKLANLVMNWRIELPIACSKSVAQQFMDNQGWEIKAIQNGSSYEVCNTSEYDKKQIRRKLGLKEDFEYFIFVGRLSEEKQPEQIVKAFKSLNEVNIGLLMLGDGPLMEKLLAYKDERISIEGFKTNVGEYLKASDYYISASDTEGLANTLLESMSNGLPMLLSNIPSHQEVVNGCVDEIGILFDNSDYKLIIRGVEQIRKFNKVQVGFNIRKYYINNFTANIMSEAYQAEYISLIKK
ncbi:MAG: glycosyltransferase [Candidatus Atribacteria bacterium]|nr:glycosyltransferase [Candidatus Atribacteria bacterium]